VSQAPPVSIGALDRRLISWSRGRRPRAQPEWRPRRIASRFRFAASAYAGPYQPAEVHISPGRPTRAIFRREEIAPCSERVVFSEYCISVMLPAFEDVAVDLPASEPGE